MIKTWLSGAPAVTVLDAASVSLAREEVRQRGHALGLPAPAVEQLALIVSELAHNQLAHARGGHLLFREIARDGVPGLEIVAADLGTGIADPRRALKGKGPSPQSLGVGLHSVRELADELDVDVRREEGTCVWARKFKEPVRRRREVGVFGRPHPEERVSGDQASFARLEHGLVLALADGLGHGPLAREAALTAITSVFENPERPLPDAIATCHEQLVGTRGAVMALSQIEEPSGKADVAPVGNITVGAAGPGVAHRFGGRSFVLGSSGALLQPRVETTTLRPWDALILWSDGLSTRTLIDDPELLRQHPVVIAQTLVERWSQEHDDALVLVAR